MNPSDTFGRWPYARRSEWIKAQRQTVASFFQKREIPTTHGGYVLADRQAWELNLIGRDRTLKDWLITLQHKRSAIGRRLPIHEWIHHGLSSQALLINLLGRVIRAKSWQIFDEILSRANVPVLGKVQNVEFEEEDPAVFHEKSGQPTSFDLACETDADERIFIEFKFTEAEFGGCSVLKIGDCDGTNPAAVGSRCLCYLNHIRRGYWDQMDRHGLTDAVLSDSTCPFAELYQPYRELLFALEKRGSYLLIYDSRNSAFVAPGPTLRGLWTRFRDRLPENAKAATHSMTVQQLADILEDSGCNWIDELRQKHDLRRAE